MIRVDVQTSASVGAWLGRLSAQSKCEASRAPSTCPFGPQSGAAEHVMCTLRAKKCS